MPEFWESSNFIQNLISKADRGSNSGVNLTEGQSNVGRLSENAAANSDQLFDQKGESSSNIKGKLPKKYDCEADSASESEYDSDYDVKKTLKLLKDELDYAKKSWNDLKNDPCYNSQDEASYKESYDEAKSNYEDFIKSNLKDSERSDYESEKDNNLSDSIGKSEGKNVVKSTDIDKNL